MKVWRTIPIDVKNGDNFQIEDRIQIGRYYTATCQKVKKSAIFMMDQYMETLHRMNDRCTNEGGYEKSYLRAFLKKFVGHPMFNEIRQSMVPFKNGDLLRIPTLEEMFSLEDFSDSLFDFKDFNFKSGKEQWVLMKDRRNRIAFCCKDQEKTQTWGWLQNTVKDWSFAVVGSYGHIGYNGASDAIGVRLVFKLSVNN